MVSAAADDAYIEQLPSALGLEPPEDPRDVHPGP